MKVDAIIKNKVSEQDFENIVYNWLADGDYTPDDIIENIITEHNLLYLPVHFYNLSYQGSLSASLGYPRSETYYVWDDHNKRQVAKTRTVIDWRPHSQNVQGQVNAAVYAGEPKFNFLADFIDEMGWSAQELNKTSQEVATDQRMLDKFHSTPQNSWTTAGEKICDRKIEKQIKASLPSTLVRNLNINIQYNLSGQLSLLTPYWIFLYDYKEKLYYVAVDGNNPSRIKGKRPENMARKNAVRAIRLIGWPAGLYLSYMGAANYSESHSNISNSDLKTILIFLLFLVITIFILEGGIMQIKNKSKARRKETLAKRKANKNT